MRAGALSGRLAVIALVATVALIPLLVPNNFQVFMMTLIGIYTMLTVGLSLVMGYAGQVSLGHATFFGVGAYATALLSARLGLPGWAALGLAALSTGLLAFVVGIPILPGHGHPGAQRHFRPDPQERIGVDRRPLRFHEHPADEAGGSCAQQRRGHVLPGLDCGVGRVMAVFQHRPLQGGTSAARHPCQRAWSGDPRG
jgi:hypothetical protein